MIWPADAEWVLDLFQTSSGFYSGGEGEKIE